MDDERDALIAGSNGMYLVSPEWVSAALKADTVLKALDAQSDAQDEVQTCQQWLRATPPKRAVFADLYAPLLDESGPRLRVLDIGGGLSGLTRGFARRHDYHLVDLLVHDERSRARTLMDEAGRDFIREEDWFSAYEDLASQSWDLVIANDLFPNVDQRLTLFLDRFLPAARQVRTSLTFYPDPRFYVTKRIDADEILTLMAWDHHQLKSVLSRYANCVDGYDDTLLDHLPASSYANGRQVCLATFSGTLAS